MNKKDYELDTETIEKIIDTVEYCNTLGGYFDTLVDHISSNTDTDVVKSLLDEYTRVVDIIEELHTCGIDEYKVIGEYSDDRVELMDKNDIVDMLKEL